MAEFYKSDIPILDIDDAGSQDLLFQHNHSFGLTARDYVTEPPSMLASPEGIQLIPRSEWDARYDEQEEMKSSLEHMYLSGPNGEPAFVNLDQGRDGDCWAYSTGHAMMFDRLKQGLPLVRLNPHGPAAMLGRPGTGGWCGLSAKFARDFGYPEEGTGPGQWPKWSHAMKYKTPELLASMEKYKSREDWYDLTLPVHGQKMTTDQLATCGFNNIPAPSDFNYWSHSVMQVRWVRIEPGSWGNLILNSWLNWGRHGLAVLRGSKAIASNAVAIRSTTASAA